MTAPITQQRLHVKAGGSTVAHLNVADVRSFEVEIPDLSAQDAISAVLGALDDKIATNTAVAHTATELAAAHASTSPTVCMLSEIATLDLRTVAPASLGTDPVPHYSIPAFDSDQQASMDAPSDIKSNKFLINAPRVLVSKLNPRLPRVWAVDHITGLPGLASTELLPLAATDVSYRVVKAVLSRSEFSRRLESQVAGTSGSHQRVRPQDLMATDIPDPRELAPEQIKVIDSLVALASQARSENLTLAALRNTLLPALMSGRLRVKDAERQVEDAV